MTDLTVRWGGMGDFKEWGWGDDFEMERGG